MYYNIEEINEYVSPLDNTFFTEEDVDVFVSRIECETKAPDFNFETGATKCVIIPCNKDYVIKIPFNGVINYDSYFADRRYKDFQPYVNANAENTWNYIEAEEELYNTFIKDSEFKDFFLIPEKIKVTTTTWPVYLQPKAEEYLDTVNCYYSKKSIETVENSKIDLKTTLPVDWLAVCLENLNGDINKLDNFILFLEHFSDLHRGNIGYLNGHAVIFDFAGYYD